MRQFPLTLAVAHAIQPAHTPAKSILFHQYALNTLLIHIAETVQDKLLSHLTVTAVLNS